MVASLIPEGQNTNQLTKLKTDGEEGLRGLIRAAVVPKGGGESSASHLSLASKQDNLYFAHESAFVDDGVQIGERRSVWHTSHILKGARI